MGPMNTGSVPFVHRWLPRGNTPCGLPISKSSGVVTNIGRTFNHGVTCQACLAEHPRPRQRDPIRQAAACHR